MFEFQWLAAFLLLPLPWLVRRLVPSARGGSPALQVSFLQRLERIRPAQPVAESSNTSWLFMFVWLLLITAAARPQWLGEPLPMSITGRDMMLAIDLSGSMEFRDMRLDGEEVERLTLVKKMLGDFIDRRHGDRLGLILFGSQAYIQAPLTHDRESVKIWLEESFTGLAGRTTSIGDAIGLAIKRLEDRPADQRVLLLVTDGASNAGRISPVQAARLAATHGIRIFSIGIGAENLPAADSSSLMSREVDPSTDLDEGTLKEIALLTGGEYFRARDADSFEAIYQRMDELEPALRESGRRHRMEPLYPYPLGLALLMTMGFASWQGRRYVV
ncbi:MAG TPA: VWA domain-containing protein [Pseudomonas xinjiangensis]|uniref:VWA domain-containing protein n=2 Tax=root TaxID=1 RepID=A0A7V1FSG9_9GAMM|nr:VWA domain-containing protein [Halopseudomonas xinjiangensis]HEC46191.1 VWA domain-containing protein [Halopseudomonas xinjiangensis]